jgi:hypothetical protein
MTMTLTPRQIEVLTDIFDNNPRPNFDTVAKRTGHYRVLNGLIGYDKFAILERKTNEITAYGLRQLEPFYADKAKIGEAIAARTLFEAERDQKMLEERQTRQAAIDAAEARRVQKLIDDTREILTEAGIDTRSMQISEIKLIADRIIGLERGI